MSEVKFDDPVALLLGRTVVIGDAEMCLINVKGEYFYCVDEEGQCHEFAASHIRFKAPKTLFKEYRAVAKLRAVAIKMVLERLS